MKTITQVASELKVKVWNIRAATGAGYITKPPMIAGRYMYDDKDIAAIRAYFCQRAKYDKRYRHLLEEPQQKPVEVRAVVPEVNSALQWGRFVPR